MQYCDPYGWHEVTGPTLEEVRRRLVNFESMTWTEILVRARKQNHSVRIEKLCADARREAAKIVPDVEELISLHVTGIKRVWGVLREGVLQIIWWDPYHLVCPSTKPNT